jgi:hypothetical protein
MSPRGPHTNRGLRESLSVHRPPYGDTGSSGYEPRQHPVRPYIAVVCRGDRLMAAAGPATHTAPLSSIRAKQKNTHKRCFRAMSLLHEVGQHWVAASELIPYPAMRLPAMLVCNSRLYRPVWGTALTSIALGSASRTR